MAIDSRLLMDLMDAARVKSQKASDEMEDLSDACRADLEIAGVYVSEGFSNPLEKQALKLYCKANYGYDQDSEKCRAADAALRDSMALFGDYAEVKEV